jgi:hypothetical protein
MSNFLDSPSADSTTLDFAEGPVGELFHDLGDELGHGVDLLSESVLAHLRRHQEGAAAGSAAIAGPLAELTYESLAAELRDLRLGALPADCPEFVGVLARASADAGQLDLLLAIHQVIHEVLWEAWFQAVERRSELDLQRRHQLLRRGSDFLFRYAERLGGHLTAAYRREFRHLGAGAEQRRFRAVEAFIGGDPLAAAALGFDFDRRHLGLVAWGEDPVGAVRRLAAELGRPLFTVASDPDSKSCWAWISGVHPLTSIEERRLAAFGPTDASIAVGLEADGEAGFRASHRQALRARLFAARAGPSLVRYQDVVVEALASENEVDARAFVAHELRGLEDDSSASQRLRETLSAYFAAEYNAASAGARLGVHQQTVANRLRAAEERLGGRLIGPRRVELEIALRLRAALADTR